MVTTNNKHTRTSSEASRDASTVFPAAGANGSPADMTSQSARIRRGLTFTIALLLGGTLAAMGCKQPSEPLSPAPAVVNVVQPVEREVTDFADFTGRVEAVESVQVQARVSGYLTKILFKEGTDVKKGDVLFEIDPRPYQAQLEKDVARLQAAEAVLEKARFDLGRLQRLFENKQASDVEHQYAVSDHNMAVAEVAAAKAAIEASKLDLGFCTIRSPIDGRISSYSKTIGNLITPDATVLTSIVSNDPMYVSFAVDELSYLRVREAAAQGKSHLRDQARAPVFLALANEQGFPHEGTINFADNQLKPTTGTIRVRAAFPNPYRQLTPGLFARVRVPLGPAHPALLVPDRAIATDQGQKLLLLVNDKNEVVARPVQPAALHDGLRVIESGLNPGDRVIVDGLLSVRPGATVKPTLVDMPAPMARTANATRHPALAAMSH